MNDELVLVIRSEVANAVSGLQKVQGEADKTGSRAQAMGKKFDAAGKKMTLMATVPIAAFIGGSVAKFNEQEKAIAEVNSAIDSMGVAWTTTEKLQQRAADLQSNSTYGDEEILHMQSVLLTFGNITDDVFNRAEQNALDMSAALGQDMQSSAIMLGKALNDPATGLTALTRVGVSFSEQQKEQIKAMAEAGDMMGAQDLMLQALESQFEGTAKAVSETAGGQMKQAMNDFGDAMESVGAVVAPILVSLAGHVSKLAQWFQNIPGPVQKIVVGLMLLVAAVGPILLIVSKMITVFTVLKPVLLAIGAAMGGISLPVLAVVAAIAAAIAIGILIWKKWDVIFPAIKGVVEPVMNAIKDVFEKVMNFIRPLVEVTLTAIKVVFEVVFNIIKTLVMVVFNAIKLYIQVTLKIWQTIIAIALWAIKAVFDKVTKAVRKAWEFVWGKIGGTVKDAWALIKRIVGSIKDFIINTFNTVRTRVVSIWNGIYNFFAPKIAAVKTLFVDGFTFIKDKISAIFSGFGEIIKGAFKSAMNWVIDKINWAIDKINGIIGGMNKVPGVNISKISRLSNLGFGGENLAGSFRVGDRGKPEVVTLPAGSSVKPVPAMGGGGSGITINLNAPQNDPMGVGRAVGWELAKRGMA